jgi:hypothetical protein
MDLEGRKKKRAAAAVADDAVNKMHLGANENLLFLSFLSFFIQEQRWKSGE